MVMTEDQVILTSQLRRWAKLEESVHRAAALEEAAETIKGLADLNGELLGVLKQLYKYHYDGYDGRVQGHDVNDRIKELDRLARAAIARAEAGVKGVEPGRN